MTHRRLQPPGETQAPLAQRQPRLDDEQAVQRAVAEPYFIAGLGAPPPGVQASHLSRVAAMQPSRLGHVARRLQRAYGNRHVAGLLSLARQEDEAEPAIQRAVSDEDEELARRTVADEEDELAQRAAKDEDEEATQRAVADEDGELTRRATADQDEEPVRRATPDENEDIRRVVADEEDQDIQRVVSDEGEELARRVVEDEEEHAQRAPVGLAGGPVAPAVERAIEGARGSGQALDGGVRAQMESAFDVDFGGVRVHTGAEADRLNRQLSARAFTTGSDIFFREGAYQPESAGGRELLAHELTHVVQQGGGVRAKLTVGPAVGAYEQEADAVARAVVEGEQEGEGREKRAEEEKLPAYAPVAGERIQRINELAHIVRYAIGDAVPSTQRRAPIIERQPETQTSPSVASTQRQRASEPPRLRFSVYLDPNPLAQYTFLRERSPETWSAFDRVARVQTFKASPEAPPSAQTEYAPIADATEANLPVSALSRVPIAPSVLADLRTRLWPLVSTLEQDVNAISNTIRDEITSRWALQNQELMTTQVHIRLLAPEDVEPGRIAFNPGLGLQPAPKAEPMRTIIGQQEVLAFSVNNKPIPSSDGALDLPALDLIGSNNLETIVAEVSNEAIVIATAGDLFRQMTVFVQQENEFWDRVQANPDEFSADTIEQHSLPIGPSLGMFLLAHAEFETELGALAQQQFRLYIRARQIHDWFIERFQQTQPEYDPSVALGGELEDALERASRNWESGDHFISIMEYLGFGLGKVWWGTQNIFTGNFYETRRQGLHAYKQGQISYNQLEELTKAAAGRGAAVGFVMLGLTLATAGLAGPILGATPTISSVVLFSGAQSAVTTMAGMTTGSIYTAQTQFEDPMLQSIWAQGQFTPGQILTGGAVSFAVGAGLGVLGVTFSKISVWLRNNRVASTGTGGLDPARGSPLAPSAAEALEPVAGDVAAGVRFRLIQADMTTGECVAVGMDLESGAYAVIRINIRTGAGSAINLATGETLSIGGGRLQPIRGALPAPETGGAIATPTAGQPPGLVSSEAPTAGLASGTGKYIALPYRLLSPALIKNFREIDLSEIPIDKKSEYLQGWEKYDKKSYFASKEDYMRYRWAAESGRLPRRSGEFQLEQSAGRVAEEIWSSISGDVHNQRSFSTDFGNVEPDFMPPRFDKRILSPQGKVLPAETPEDALFIADTKILSNPGEDWAPRSIGLTDQIRGFVELAQRTQTKTLVFLGQEGAKITDMLSAYAASKGVSIVVKEIVTPSGFVIKG